MNKSDSNLEDTDLDLVRTINYYINNRYRIYKISALLFIGLFISILIYNEKNYRSLQNFQNFQNLQPSDHQTTLTYLSKDLALLQGVNPLTGLSASKTRELLTILFGLDNASIVRLNPVQDSLKILISSRGNKNFLDNLSLRQKQLNQLVLKIEYYLSTDFILSNLKLEKDIKAHNSLWNSKFSNSILEDFTKSGGDSSNFQGKFFIELNQYWHILKIKAAEITDANTRQRLFNIIQNRAQKYQDILKDYTFFCHALESRLFNKDRDSINNHSCIGFLQVVNRSILGIKKLPDDHQNDVNLSRFEYLQTDNVRFLRQLFLVCITSILGACLIVTLKDFIMEFLKKLQSYRAKS